MKLALISDIHANLEALQAVRDDLRARPHDAVYCLGDIIGYGPNPCECLDLVMDLADIVILGNHDQAALFDPEGFNPVALNAVYWTRDQLDRVGPPPMTNKRWDFLGELPRKREEGEYLFVHGSPREPTNEYVFPEDVYNERKLDVLFDHFELYCFQGHTHIPGIFTAAREFLSPDESGGSYQLLSDKVMVNVGSVGQPRDGDPRACYVTLDTETGLLEFHRVEYDVEHTANKVYAVTQLDNMLGDRLRSGR